MVTVDRSKQNLTLTEFLELPETKPVSEYINGKIEQKPMPQGKHSILQRELTFAIMMGLKQQKTGQAFPELRCTFDARSIVPEIAIFRQERIPRDENGQVANAFNLPPDWIIEILSPQQSQSKVVRNIIHCLDNGTMMGWLLDPQESLIFVYHQDKSVQLFEVSDSLLSVPDFAEAVQLTPNEIFAWLKE
ncbi:MAG: Uma2 family endonuclease [Crocosphaera sp.]